MCRVAAGADLADGFRVAGAQAGIAADTTRRRAARSPALVRSAISARSNWATAPSTCSENMPCGVVVSIGSRRLRKCAPTASSCSMTARRWLTERARRSSLTTTRVSPGRISCSRRASTGRLRSAPEACSSHRGAAGRAQLVELRIGGLFLGRDPRIAFAGVAEGPRRSWAERRCSGRAGAWAGDVQFPRRAGIAGSRLSAYRALVLLRHSFCLTVCSGGRPLQGQRGRTSTSVRARRIRSVAMEFGMWRCDRSGRSSGSVTSGKGRLPASPGAGRS
jgi:hypothetical protein